jgi:hypothetical protein
MTLFTSSTSFADFTNMKFDFLAKLKYYWYCVVFWALSCFTNIERYYSTLHSNKKTSTIMSNPIKWSDKDFATFERNIELRILPESSWILEMSYDDGEFTRYCATRYPALNFVFFTMNTQTYNRLRNNFPKNAHVFFMTPDHFIKHSNTNYEDFIINNRVGYRRVFASQGTECWSWNKMSAIFGRIDKSLYKDYDNPIKSYFLLYKLTASDCSMCPFPGYHIKQLWSLRHYNHLKEISVRISDVGIKLPFNIFSNEANNALMSVMYKRGDIKLTKHVFHPRTDFVPNN